MIYNAPQDLYNRLLCLTSSPPGHFPPTILPLQRKARGAISEAQWICGTLSTIPSLPLPSMIILLQRKARGAISEVHTIYGTAVRLVHAYTTNQQIYTHHFPERTIYSLPLRFHTGRNR